MSRLLNVNLGTVEARNDCYCHCSASRHAGGILMSAGHALPAAMKAT